MNSLIQSLLLLVLILIVLSILGCCHLRVLGKGNKAGQTFSRQKFTSLCIVTLIFRFGKMIIWILSLSRLSWADLQGFEEVLLLQRAYWQLVLSLQMTGIQIGQEWPIWGWKLIFPAVFNSVFSWHGETTPRKTYSKNIWDEPASSDVHQRHQAKFKILQNVVGLLTWSPKKKKRNTQTSIRQIR